MDTTDTKKYYQMAHAASLQVGDHRGLQYLHHAGSKAQKILDVGCGEGTRLASIVKPPSQGVGVEINKYAVEVAKKQYPHLKFIHVEGEKLPFPDNSFDLVYSAYVLEHTQDHVAFLLELIRVCTPGGQIITLCPNFGAPNRRSPVSIESPYKKLWQGLVNPPPIDQWKKVTPRKHFDNPDDDTTMEPEVTSLVNFFKSQGLKIEKAYSIWEEEIFSLNPRKLIIHVLGKLGISPFVWWGPQVFVVARKP